MTTKTTRTRQIQAGNFLLHKTTFEKAGDTASFAVRPFSRLTYPIRHVVASGSFACKFPGTGRQDDPMPDLGGVWPLDTQYDVTTFNVEALTDNASYYCVAPAAGGELGVDERVSVAAGETCTVEQGKIVFVYGERFTINGTENVGNEVFLAETGPAEIVAVTPLVLTVVRYIRHEFVQVQSLPTPL